MGNVCVKISRTWTFEVGQHFIQEVICWKI